ncbi:MAG: peptide ABC transporter substrate-binding protein [Tepidisphaeraceae bacterium]
MNASLLSRRLITTLLPALLLSASCDRDKADDAKTFRFINRGDIYTLDLNEMSYSQDIRVTYLTREGLYSPTGPQYTPIPAGATSVDISADQCVYTFHLRPNAKWSNGDTVKAGDYEFSWRYMLQQPGEYTYLFYYIRGAEAYKDAYAAGKDVSFDTVGIKAIDDLTFQVTLKQPVAYFIDLVAFTPFYPRHEPSMRPFADKDPKTGHVTYRSEYTRPPAVVTNGAFALTDWKFKRILRFTPNRYYWDAGKVKLDEIDMLVNDNTLSSYLQFTAKSLDWIVEVQQEIAPELKQKNVEGLHVAPSFTTQYLTMSCKPTLPDGSKNPMADVRVRQVLAYAIDKKFIVENVTRLGEKVATTFVPPGTLPGYESLPGLGYDVEKARQLLADAGYPGGKGFGRVTFLYNSENSTRARIAQVLSQQWQKALGINIEIEGVEGKTFSERLSGRDFAMAAAAWTGDYPDVSTFTDKYQSASLQNDASWINPEYDRLLNQAAAEPDKEKRLNSLRQAEQLLNTEGAVVPLYHPVTPTLIGSRVRGLVPNARLIVDWKSLSFEDAKSP